MTRDKAIKLYSDAVVGKLDSHFVDGLVALGLLKFDAPTVPDYAADLTIELQSLECHVSLRDIEKALKAVGLKLVCVKDE